MLKLWKHSNIHNLLKTTNNSINSVSKLYHPLLFPEAVSVDGKVRTKSLPGRLSKPREYELFPKFAELGLLVQVRQAHTDIPEPDFDYYRRKDLKDPKVVESRESEETHKGRISILMYFGGLGGVVTAKHCLTKTLHTMNPSLAAIALATSEVDISNITEGKCVTHTWRDKPIFVMHRTQKQIDEARNCDLSQLRDPETDEERVKVPKFLIVIGICTHLGCIPIPHSGNYGGFFCPCHGSHYDFAGRIRQGPAVSNLEIPPYEFTDENTLFIG